MNTNLYDILEVEVFQGGDIYTLQQYMNDFITKSKGHWMLHGPLLFANNQYTQMLVHFRLVE